MGLPELNRFLNVTFCCMRAFGTSTESIMTSARPHVHDDDEGTVWI